MKKGWFCFSMMAIASIGLACYHAMAGPILSACNAVKDFVVGALKLTETEGSGFAKPSVNRVQAKAFAQRIEKREAHVITSSWRMCPSI